MIDSNLYLDKFSRKKGKAIVDLPNEEPNNSLEKFYREQLVDPREKEFKASETLPFSVSVPGDDIAGFTKAGLQEMINLSWLAYKPDNQYGESSIQPTARDIEAKSKKLKTISYYKEEGWTVKSFKYNSKHHKDAHACRIFFKDDKVIITYQGTASKAQGLKDLNSGFATSSLLPGRMHRGFLTGWKDTWDVVYKEIYEHAQSMGKEVKDLSYDITGHSLGGAYAKLAAFRLSEASGVENIRVATFGDPRVFDFEASEKYNEKLGEKTVRVTNQTDIVPKISPKWTGFNHAGLHLSLESNGGNFLHNHKLSTYSANLNKLQDDQFVTNTNKSFFGKISQSLSQVNAILLGGIHKQFDKLYHKFQTNKIEPIEARLKKQVEKVAEGLTGVKQQSELEPNNTLPRIGGHRGKAK